VVSGGTTELVKRFRKASYEPIEGVSSTPADTVVRDSSVTFGYRKFFDTDPLT